MGILFQLLQWALGAKPHFEGKEELLVPAVWKGKMAPISVGAFFFIKGTVFISKVKE